MFCSKHPLYEITNYQNVRLPRCPFAEMSAYRNVRLPNCPHNEMSAYRNVRLPKCLLTEMSTYWNVRLSKCPHTEMTYVEMSVTEFSEASVTLYVMRATQKCAGFADHWARPYDHWARTYGLCMHQHLQSEHGQLANKFGWWSSNKKTCKQTRYLYLDYMGKHTWLFHLKLYVWKGYTNECSQIWTKLDTALIKDGRLRMA